MKRNLSIQAFTKLPGPTDADRQGGRGRGGADQRVTRDYSPCPRSLQTGKNAKPEYPPEHWAGPAPDLEPSCHVAEKLFKKKLMTSFFALLLIIKMIKVKLMFLLPLILGVGTAKKLLLKVLLFLFPALSHLFKLCSYYHANYAKYHHHHHKVGTRARGRNKLFEMIKVRELHCFPC